MTWPIAVVCIFAFGAVVALTHVVLPFVRRRGDIDKRAEALEKATVEMADRVARLEQALDYLSSGTRLPRTGVTRTG